MVRRNKGEGSITERKDGSWQGALQIEGKRRFVTGKTEKEVKAKLAALQREAHQNGGLSDPGTRTLNDLLDLWLETAAPSLKPRTVHDYECLSRRYVRPVIGHLKLMKVTPERLQALYSSLQQRKLARVPAHVHALLHRALGMAVMWRMIPLNPADRVLKPGYRAEREDCWTGEQLSAFLRGTSQDRHGPLWMFMATTGCRIGEVLALRWDLVDLDAGTVAIKENVQRIGNQWVTCKPKTRAGERTITLPAMTVAALRRQKASLAARRLKAGPAWQDGGLVFPGLGGAPVCTSTIHRALTDAAKRVGVPVIGPHQLRHTHASRLVAQGLPITGISARLGHSTPAITLRIYSHELAGQDTQAAQAMEAVLAM